MFGSELLVPLARRERLRRLDESTRALGVFFDIHEMLPQTMDTPQGGVSRVNPRRPLAATLSAIWARLFGFKEAPRSAAARLGGGRRFGAERRLLYDRGPFQRSKGL